MMRLRFAPSPTGFLHIGNARTAIINYLLSKKYNAVLVLRIEDTDVERSSRESEESILRDLQWLGIQWHEGPDVGGNFGPYRQSERLEIYKQFSEQLLKNGNAYYCFCTQEELETMRARAFETGTYEYSGRCRNLSTAEKERFRAEGRKPTIRFRVPENETVIVDDAIKGKVVFSSENIGGDFIIVRSDGMPVYNYIVIIDDALMKITHVVRGEDHLSNTPKQILIARALNLPVPQYAHLALVMGNDRKKLSKRHGITSVDLYRKEGYLPEALVNYLAMLGWAAEDEREILSMQEIVAQIELEKLAKSAAIFDFQKLRWMNSHYVRLKSAIELLPLIQPYLQEVGIDANAVEREKLLRAIELLKPYCELLSDIKNFAPMLLSEIPAYDEEAKQILMSDEATILIKEAFSFFSETPSSDIGQFVNVVKAKTGFKGKQLFHPLRALLTGKLKGPELDQVISLLGYDGCKKRVEYAHRIYIEKLPLEGKL
ncbi:MAG: glutamate--tRNA ligase [Spirochaetes bacterium]|nr:glutamate--tRNA ligase [Spirochaetota bacterium]